MLHTSPDKDGKVEKLLTTPIPKASGKALMSMSELGLIKLHFEEDLDFNDNAITITLGLLVDKVPLQLPCLCLIA